MHPRNIPTYAPDDMSVALKKREYPRTETVQVLESKPQILYTCPHCGRLTHECGKPQNHDPTG